MSSSIARPPTRYRSLLRRRLNIASCPLNDGRNGAEHLLELRRFAREPLPAQRCDAIEARAASGLGLAPLRAHPSVDEQPLKRGIERALADLQHVGRRLFQV